MVARLQRLWVSLLTLFAIAACGGLASGPGGGGESCVTIDPSTYDHACNVDADCTLLPTGQLCSGQCRCGGTALSSHELGRWQAATAGLSSGTCPCPAQFPPACINHVCTACDGPRSGTCGASDGGACVNVDVTTFNRGCSQDTDCASITAGKVCPNACLCGGTGAINRSDMPRYQSLIANIPVAECPCVSPGPLRCIAQVCTQCGFGPNQPPGCTEASDAGSPDGD